GPGLGRPRPLRGRDWSAGFDGPALSRQQPPFDLGGDGPAAGRSVRKVVDRGRVPAGAAPRPREVFPPAAGRPPAIPGRTDPRPPVRGACRPDPAGVLPAAPPPPLPVLT